MSFTWVLMDDSSCTIAVSGRYCVTDNIDEGDLQLNRSETNSITVRHVVFVCNIKRKTKAEEDIPCYPSN